MTSAISRAANAAHAHGFAKSVKNDAPAEGFEALFAAVANSAVAPAVLPSGGERGKPGERAHEEEKKGSASAFELAASMALAAADVGKSEVRALPIPVVKPADAANVIQTAQVPQAGPPRVASNSPPDFVLPTPVRPAAYVPLEVVPKPESRAAATERPPRNAHEIRAEVAQTNVSAPMPSAIANALPAKTMPTPIDDNEPVVANVAARAMPVREAHVTHVAHITPSSDSAGTPQPAARPRVELSPRALAQASIVEAMRSPGRGRPQQTGEGASSTAKDVDPVVPPSVSVSTMPVAQAINAASPRVAAAMSALVADESPPLAEPVSIAPTPSKPAASSRAAADILRQRQYALGTDASPVGDIVPESAATFDTLIALRKADGAFEGHASPAGDHESAAPVNSGPWLPNLPSSAAAAAPSASIITAPRVFDQAAWSAALAQQVTASAVAAAKETTVRVEPEGLGPIEVRVRVESGHVDVRFAIEHPVTMTMVRAALPDLERMLAQSGLNLGDAQIAQQNAEQRQQSAPDRGASSNVHDDEPAVAASAIESRPRARVGLLDDFV
jgi:flagellar hook-length control protein FliK